MSRLGQTESETDFIINGPLVVLFGFIFDCVSVTFSLNSLSFYHRRAGRI